MIHRGGHREPGSARPRARIFDPRRTPVASLLALAATGLLAAAEPAPAPAGLVDGWLEQARSAESQGRFDEARSVLRHAAGQAPEDLRIDQALRRLDSVVSGRGPAAQPEVLAEWARSEIRQARSRAELMARAGRPGDAVEQLEVVRQALRVRGLDADPQVAADLAAVETATAGYRTEQQEMAASRSRTERDRLLAEAAQRADGLTSSSATTREARMARITELRARGHLELALAECRALVDRSPEDEELRSFYRDLLADAHRARRTDHATQAEDLRQELVERLGRELIPSGFDGMPTYPADWAKRTRSASRLEGTEAEPGWKSALRDALRGRTSLDVEAQNGIEVLNALAASTHLNLVIDPELAAGQERIVTLHAPSISVENALGWICREMDASWSMTRGAIWVGRPQSEDATLAVYDIATLIYTSLDQPGRSLSLGGGGGGAGGGANGNATFATDTQQTPPPTPEEVVDLLKVSVTPDAWKDESNGITIRGTTLYITAPPDTHRLLREFIRAQEANANLMVKVDTRWLTIEDSYLEEIGVDWNLGSLLTFPGIASGFTRQNPNSTFTGSTSNVLPATAVTQSPPLQSTGLTLQFGLIGPTQISAILYAAERNLRSRVLASPSVTTLNGVRANVFIGEEAAYISDYEITSGNYDPVITVLPTGVVLDVKPFISADRKYVTMDFRPAITSVQLWTDYITAVRTGGTFDDGVNPPSAISPAVIYPIELPNLTVREAATTLTIPDRGSALIGGFDKAIDQTSEARVPFLGDIPYLGRLFGHRGRYSEREKRYLLATITIISYDEQEAKL